MPPFKIGYNINAEAPGANRQLAADYQIALHSTFALVLDDYLKRANSPKYFTAACLYASCASSGVLKSPKCMASPCTWMTASHQLFLCL